MADFPDSLYNPRTKQNRSGVVYDATKTKQIFAEDVTKLDDEVVAIENYLGFDQAEVHETVNDRLADLYFNGNTIIGYNRISSPADSTTYYSGMAGRTMQTSNASFAFYIFQKCTLWAVRWRIVRTGTVPTSEACSLYLTTRGTDYLLSNTLDFSTTSSYTNLTTISADLVATNTIYFKLVTPAWVTNPGEIYLQTQIMLKPTIH